MRGRSPHPGPGQIEAIEDLIAGALLAVVGVVAAVSLVALAGAELAALLSGNGAFDAGLGDSISALAALSHHVTEPERAWPEPARDHLPGPVLYWLATTVVVAALATIGLVGIRWWTGHRRGRGAFGAGEGGLASGRDVHALAVRHPTSGRLTLGLHGRQLLAAEPQTSLAVVGPTGCGKTVGFAIPALLEWNGPIVATSVKTDLLDATLAHRTSVGTTWVYDPSHCTGLTAAKWSPLSACTDWVGAMRVAAWLCEAAQPKSDSVTDGDYWYSQARKGIAPYLYAAAGTGRTMTDVVRWVDTQDQDEVEEALVDIVGLDQALAELTEAGRRDQLRTTHTDEVRNEAMADARDLYRDAETGRNGQWIDQELLGWPPAIQQQVNAEIDAELERRVTQQMRTEARDLVRSAGEPIPALVAAQALWAKEKRLKGSVFATMENVLAGYADPGVGEASSASEIDVAEWLTGNNTIFVVATAHEQARLRPVLTVLIQQAIRAAYDAANERGGTLEHPCLVLLDEAGNIAPLRDLPGYASTARSHGITLVSIWQDLAQIKAIYGDRAQTVLNNHRAKLFGSGIADDPTLEYVSRLIGDERRTEVNKSGDLHGPRRSVSEHTSWRRFAPVDAVRRLRTGEGILLYGSLPPVWLRLRPPASRPPRVGGCPRSTGESVDRPAEVPGPRVWPTVRWMGGNSKADRGVRFRAGRADYTGRNHNGTIEKRNGRFQVRCQNCGFSTPPSLDQETARIVRRWHEKRPEVRDWKLLLVLAPDSHSVGEPTHTMQLPPRTRVPRPRPTPRRRPLPPTAVIDVPPDKK